MRLALVLLAAILLLAGPARAQSTTQGGSALAIAALVGAVTPQVSASDKKALAALFEDRTVTYPAGKTITVTADSVVCQAGDVDIAAHSCALTFGKATVTLTGRKAHEMFATITELGVRPDGAMGRSYESLSRLSCVVNPGQVQQKDGSGARCQFKPGSP